MKALALGGFAVAAIAALIACNAAAEPVNIRISYPAAAASLAPMFPMVPKEIQPHYGKSYVVEPIFMAGATQALTAIAAKEMEFGTLTPQALAIGVVEAKLDLVVVGQAFSTEIDGYAKNHFWVRKDEVKNFSDLKGKVLAVNARGSAIAAAVTLMMRKHGLEVNRDYQAVEVPFPATLAALESKRISLGYLVRPWGQTAEKNPALAPLFGPGEVYGPQETGMWTARPDFVAKNRAALVDFFEDQMRFRRWAHDPKTRMEAVTLLAKVAKQPVESFADWLLTKEDTSTRDLDCRIDVARLQRNVDAMAAAEVVPGKIDAAKHVDMSLVNEAKARLAK
jgi:NitT/TauT family transport system substrate-binding protein